LAANAFANSVAGVEGNGEAAVELDCGAFVRPHPTIATASTTANIAHDLRRIAFRLVTQGNQPGHRTV
jgi:hypothetical protein